jgi:hypothetical protein
MLIKKRDYRSLCQSLEMFSSDQGIAAACSLPLGVRVIPKLDLVPKKVGHDPQDMQDVMTCKQTVSLAIPSIPVTNSDLVSNEHGRIGSQSVLFGSKPFRAPVFASEPLDDLLTARPLLDVWWSVSNLLKVSLRRPRRFCTRSVQRGNVNSAGRKPERRAGGLV